MRKLNPTSQGEKRDIFQQRETERRKGKCSPPIEPVRKTHVRLHSEARGGEEKEGCTEAV